MNGWKSDDEVTTTAGSIWAAQQEAEAQGRANERERIRNTLEAFQADGVISLSIDYVLALIEDPKA